MAPIIQKEGSLVVVVVLGTVIEQIKNNDRLNYM